MYQLITKDTNFKKMKLYYSEYTRGTVYFHPIIRRVYVRTIVNVSDGVVLVGEGINILVMNDEIPQEGTISIKFGNDAILSTSKQEIARFWKKQLFRDFKFSHFAYNNYDFTARQNQYKMCMALLKKLS